jgi:hypothetical protein
MRKYILPVLGFYIDFIFINSLVSLMAHLARSAGREIDPAYAVPASWGLILSLILVGRRFDFSIGQQLLSYAKAERELGLTTRQWPNLVTGTLMILSGLKELVNWTAPGQGLPLFLLVEETPLKIGLLTILGGICLLAGIMMLRFTPGAKSVSAAVLVFSGTGLAVSFYFARDALVAAQMARRANQGLQRTMEDAERMISFMPYFLIVFFAVAFWMLYLCRERPGAAVQAER